MTKHAFQDWQDNNETPDNGHAPDAAVNTLRDILSLAEENLPAATVAARVQVIARACLSRLGVAVPVEVDDVGGPSGLQFPDDETAYIGPDLADKPPPF